MQKTTKNYYFSVSVEKIFPSEVGEDVWRLSRQEGDEVGGDFDGEGEEAVEGDEEAAPTAAAHFEEGAFVAVHRAADDAHTAPDHVGGEFRRQIVDRIFAETGGADEALHFGVADSHRDAVAQPAAVAVLEGGYLSYRRIEPEAGGADEQQVVDYRPGFAYASILSECYPGYGRGVDLKTFFGKPSPGGGVGIGTRKISHDKPFLLFVRRLHGEWRQKCGLEVFRKCLMTWLQSVAFSVVQPSGTYGPRPVSCQGLKGTIGMKRIGNGYNF